MGVPTAHYKAPHARPSLSVSTHHRQPFYDLVPRDPKRHVPLTNNEQIWVAPGESTPNPKAGRAIGPDSSGWPRSGQLTHHCGQPPSFQVWTSKGSPSPLAQVI